MKKVSWKLLLVLVVVSIGFLGVVPALATVQDGPVPVIATDDSYEPGDFICDQNEGGAAGSDGDPDSAGDGLGFMGDSLFDFLDGDVGGGDGTLEEYMRFWFQNLIPQP